MFDGQPAKTRDMLGRTSVVSLDTALHILAEAIPSGKLPPETIPLDRGLSRILSQSIQASEDLPGHPRSVMDGYAVKAHDTFGASENLPAYLEIQGDVQMGMLPTVGPTVGGCFTIATGGLLPQGTDAVVPFEHTVHVDGASVEITRPVAAGEHVIQAGDDVRKNEPLLPPGHRLRPQDLGLMAGMGMIQLSVYRLPQVGVISTGDEIVAPDKIPPPGKFRDMNSVQIATMVEEAGGVAKQFGIVGDNEETFEKALRQALQECDMVVFSGSSSVGSRDMGEKLIEKLSPQGMLLHGVAIKPGKPVMAAMVSGKPVFGLPGHPVSAAMAFSLFVSPALQRLSGLARLPQPVYRTSKALLMRSLNSAAGRTDFVRVRIQRNKDDQMEAQPVLGKSGALSTLVKAHGFFVIPEKSQGIRQGDKIIVHLFN